ncbi:uncharacterized protein LOC131077399 [Cryptomeria japonica]|uniref:uncharacterized protein LOC131077399 n=1 Tax=Cryptomeria japonica TaxID=3369 RepID=UPI0027DA498A|nr:uncharacterized protein LOC131077399 [Cryptomeria japonica]
MVEESPHNAIPISAYESPPNHQQESVVEVPKDTPASSLVERRDELLAKKDKLEEENPQLVTVVHKITKLVAEESNPTSSSSSQESIRGVESAAQKSGAVRHLRTCQTGPTGSTSPPTTLAPLATPSSDLWLQQPPPPVPGLTAPAAGYNLRCPPLQPSAAAPRCCHLCSTQVNSPSTLLPPPPGQRSAQPGPHHLCPARAPPPRGPPPTPPL